MSSSPRGILLHHTACGEHSGDDPSLVEVIKGRALGTPQQLVGPLCNLLLARSGTYHMIAAGKAYHAGLGAISFVPVENAGNTFLIGIEAENDGTGEPWGEAIMDAYARGCAAILKHLGLGADRCIGHKEYAPHRKIDPDFDMNAFRARVSACMETPNAAR